MAIIGPTLPNPVSAAVNPAAAASSSSGSTGAVASSSTLAGNFNTFLKLLTTQLQNQNPLSPLDTNQFTQQLVEFDGVEQQINMNTQLGTLISLQKSSQVTTALNFVGATVAIDGSTAQLANGKPAAWTFSATKPANAAITISNASGQTVFTDNQVVQAGQQTYAWNGRDSSGASLPPGLYTISITAKDANGQTTAISTQVQGVVDSVDVSQNPPILSIGGQNIPLDKIKQVFRPGL